VKVSIERITNWNQVYKEALATENKIPKPNAVISDSWKIPILLAEHSPIRTLEYRIEWIGIKYWVAMELRTHQIGVWHPEDLVFISTQRDDRTADTIPRDKKTQDALVKMVTRLNAQSIINISRKRLCSKATIEAQEAWREALKILKELDPALAEVCVQECLYRGFCPERKTCGYSNGLVYINRLLKYRHGGKDGGQENDVAQDQCAQQEVRSIQSRKQKGKKCRKKGKDPSAKTQQATNQNRTQAGPNQASSGSAKVDIPPA